MTPSSTPFIAIIMPALNEEQHIEGAITSILPRQGRLAYEILVMDGGSSDRTTQIVEQMQHSNTHLRLIDNPGRIQSAAMNLAVQMCDPRTTHLVRADCHAHYPEHFVEDSVKTLIDKRAASVVVPLISEGQGCVQKAIATTQASPLGNGGSHHRLKGKHGFIDHGHHAAFRKDKYLEIGGYDENFTHNEDAEFDHRLHLAGGKIYLNGDLVVRYAPRASFAALARQYWNYGKGRAKNMLKHGTKPKLRQMIPVFTLAACIASLALASLFPWLLALPIAYGVITFAWGAGLAITHKAPCLLMSGPAAMVMHMSWASGFILQVAFAGMSRCLSRKTAKQNDKPLQGRVKR